MTSPSVPPPVPPRPFADSPRQRRPATATEEAEASLSDTPAGNTSEQGQEAATSSSSSLPLDEPAHGSSSALDSPELVASSTLSTTADESPAKPPSIHTTTTTTTESSSTVVREPPKPLSADKRHIAQQLEDIDLAAFLARQTRDFSEARVTDVEAERLKRQAPEWRPPEDLQPWEHGATLARLEQLLFKAAEHLPADMVADFNLDDDPRRLSISRVRAASERMYMLCPPSNVQHMITAARDIAFWRRPVLALTLLLVYSVALYKDLCLPLAFTGAVLGIISNRLFPPNAAQMQAQLDERRKLAKEAKEIGQDFELRGQLTSIGTFLSTTSSAAAAQTAKEQEGQSQEGPASSSGTDDNDHQTPTLQDPAQLIREKTQEARSAGKPNTISLAKDIGQRFGPDIQCLIEDGASVGEKMRNLVLFRDPKASWRVLSGWSVVALSLFYVPVSAISRAVWGGLGLHFFCFAYLRHRFPRYRRFFNPLHWALLGLPTDATAARIILHRRAASGQTVTTLKDFKRMDRRAPSEAPALPPRDKSTMSRTENMRSFFTSTKSRISQAKDLVNGYSFDKDSDHGVGKSFFCFQGKSPGRLVLEDENVRFDGIKAGFSSKSRATAPPPSPLPVDDAGASPTAARMTRMAYTDIAGLKKLSSFGDPAQLLITTHDGTSYKFSKLTDRSEAFLKILLKCPQLASVSG